MNIANLIKEKINVYQVTEPIIVDELFNGLENHKEAVYVTLNRLVGDGVIVHYNKGVYFKPKNTKFGKIGVDKKRLIEKKYLKRNNKVVGYITGPLLWNDWGLTTQIPNRIWIAQDIKQKKIDEDLGVMLVKAKTAISEKNIKALQFLDVIDQIEYIQDADKEEIIRKLIHIFREKLTIFDKVVVMEEVKNYTKKVKVLFGLIAEATVIDNEYFLATLNYLKEDVSIGKKTIININPLVFKNNRTWGNGFASS
ncbi:MAG: hypothetical protein FD141_1559 [Fusobacteria bacterium]|nr:MAG: hypothetical protein FD141_1559 [Fusobacteriota bacterium]KAF0230272.1 MAG: hypothetical protein FD182_662 [Fusobacteriota bacterium]